MGADRAWHRGSGACSYGGMGAHARAIVWLWAPPDRSLARTSCSSRASDFAFSWCTCSSDSRNACASLAARLRSVSRLAWADASSARSSALTVCRSAIAVRALSASAASCCCASPWPLRRSCSSRTRRSACWHLRSRSSRSRSRSVRGSTHSSSAVDGRCAFATRGDSRAAGGAGGAGRCVAARGELVVVHGKAGVPCSVLATDERWAGILRGDSGCDCPSTRMPAAERAAEQQAEDWAQ